MTNPIIVGVALREDDSAPIALGRDLARLTGAPLALVHAYPYEQPSAVPAELVRDGDTRALARRARSGSPRRCAASSTSPSAPARGRRPPPSCMTPRPSLGRRRSSSSAPRTAGASGASCPAASPRGSCTARRAPWPWRRAGYAGGRAFRRIGVALHRHPGGTRRARRRGADGCACAVPRVRMFTVHHERATRDPPLAVPGWADPAAMEEQSLLTGGRRGRARPRAGSRRRARGRRKCSPGDARRCARQRCRAELDLLVCGSRGYGPVHAVMLGGVSRALVDEAACPGARPAARGAPRRSSGSRAAVARPWRAEPMRVARGRRRRRGARDGPRAAHARRPTAVDRAARARRTASRDRPGSVATAFGFGAAAPLPLEGIARREGVELRRGALAAVDADRRRATTRPRASSFAYDALVVATGARARPCRPGRRRRSPVPRRRRRARTRSSTRAAAGAVRRARRSRCRPASRGACRCTSSRSWPPSSSATATSRDACITVVTPEHQPLWLFGPAAGDSARAPARPTRGIALRTNARAIAMVEDGLLLAGRRDRRRQRASWRCPCSPGRGVPGLPGDAEGFIPVNAHGRVAGAEGRLCRRRRHGVPRQAGRPGDAAGRRRGRVDRCSGWALFQKPAPFRPVLRGLLLTGGAPLYLRAELSSPGDVLRTHGATIAGPRGETSTRALWWPPAKVAGRYLGPYLSSARPRALGREPLQDRTPAASVAPSDDDAFALAVLVAEEDALLGDFDQALLYALGRGRRPTRRRPAVRARGQARGHGPWRRAASGWRRRAVRAGPRARLARDDARTSRLRRSQRP